MLRRRQKSHTMIRTACGRMIEELERRQLLTTISGSGILEYKDASDGLVRIAYSNVTAELIFGNVNDAHPTKAVLTDLVPAFDEDTDGRDLFHVYVQSGTIDSYLSIARVPDLDSDNRPMDPFGGGVAMNIFNAQNGRITSVTSGPGDVLLGSLTRQIEDVDNSENRPIIQSTFYGLGIMPATNSGKLMAGLSLAPGQDLGRFLFGGTIIGAVNVPSGSIDTFYCGALLTGNASGQGATTGEAPPGTVLLNPGLGIPTIPNNFNVGGDMRNLLVGGSIGTDGPQANPDRPRYVTGVDIEIKGKSSQIRAFSTIIAKTWVFNDPAAAQDRANAVEIETKDFNPRGDATDFEFGLLGDHQAMFNNDTFDTPQFLGVWNSSKLGSNSIQIRGLVQRIINNDDDNDPVDYYALPLMSGQQIKVRMINGIVGIYDPDRRLVSTNYATNVLQYGNGTTGANPNALTTLNESPFIFTAQKPGIYRFAVGTFGGTETVNGQTVNGGFQGIQLFGGGFVYSLQIQNAGNLGLGALAATNLIYNSTNTGGPLVPPAAPSACVVNGDFGAVWVGTGGPGRLIYSSVQGKADILANGGNLRAVEAEQIGLTQAATADQAATFTLGQGIFVKRGDVGLIRARNGDLILQDLHSQQKEGKGAGGNIQVISADNGFFWGQLYADRAIGSIAVESMATTLPSRFEANVDQLHRDGIIDLIDVTEDLGYVGAGGPAIITHAGGNVRYMRAGGNVFRDSFFGGGTPEVTTFVQGQSATFTDDSGSQVKITPTQATIDPGTGTTLTLAGTLTAITYPVRSGGVVIMNVTSTRGMTVSTNALSNKGALEIGMLQSLGVAPALISDPGPDGVANTGDEPLGPDGVANSGDEPLILDPTSTTLANDIIIKGGKTDVLEVNGNSFGQISNRTSGEIVSTTINGSVGTIAAAGSIGLPKHSTPAPIRPVRIGNIGNSTPLGLTDGIAFNFPYRDQRNAIVVIGNVGKIQSTYGIGNLLVDGRVASVVANSDGKRVKGVFEGISGPLYASGNLDDVNIGEGVLPSGSGDPSQAGIYSHGRIGLIKNQGLGSDIRGAIASTTNIDTISLSNGAIIGARIGIISASALNVIPTTPSNDGQDLEAIRHVPNAVLITGGNNQFGLPQGEISHIGLSGSGGITGAYLIVGNLGPIEVKNGFGILNTQLNMTGSGRMQPIVADGYGIRNSVFRGGAFALGFQARTTGKQLSTNAYTPSVLLSRFNKFDPYFGTTTDFFTDLYSFLGTSSTKPTRQASTYGGAIENSTFVSSRDLGSFTANSIKNNTVSFGNEVGTIAARSTISGLNLTAGSLQNLTTGGFMERSQLVISGPLTNGHIGGSFKGSNSILAQGPNGTISSFVTDGSLFGRLEGVVSLGTIRVGADVGSSSIHTDGNLNQLIVNGSLLTGTNVDISKTLSRLIVGGDVQEGATVTARTILEQAVRGETLGTIQETG